MAPPIPTIDLQCVDADALRATLRACEEFSAFAVAGHGFPRPLFERSAELVADFFARPLAEKQHWVAEASPTGFAHEPRRNDDNESLFCSTLRPNVSPSVFPAPERTAWPDQPEALAPTLRDCRTGLHGVASQVAGAPRQHLGD